MTWLVPHCTRSRRWNSIHPDIATSHTHTLYRTLLLPCMSQETHHEIKESKPTHACVGGKLRTQEMLWFTSSFGACMPDLVLLLLRAGPVHAACSLQVDISTTLMSNGHTSNQFMLFQPSITTLSHHSISFESHFFVLQQHNKRNHE